MKKLLLSIALVGVAAVSFAQVVVKGISPASVQLNFDYNVQANCGSWPGETDDGTWPVHLDFNQAGVYVQGELKLVEDGTPGTNAQGNPISQEGCNPLINDLTGKIAVIYRNTCSFGSKIAYAQDAGAIAVIIVNREDAALGMLADALFPNDTIPAVILSNTDGEFIVSQMDLGPVEMFIGNKIGVFGDDMATGKGDIVMAESSSIPSALAQNGTELDLDLGVWAYNMGSNAQTGVTASVEITDPSSASIYSMTSSTPLDFAAPVGLLVDTQYFALGNFAPATWATGTYTITYTITTQNADEDAVDNVASSQFTINGSQTYAKCRIDGANNPIAATAYSLNESTTQYDNFETCIQFKDANASRLEAKGITFSCRPVGSTMAFQSVGVRMYEWNDVFTDANDPAFPTAAGPGPWNVNQVGSSSYLYFDESENGVNKYLAFDEGSITLNDNQRYLFCVYNDSDSLRIGFDNQIDYTSTVNNYLEYSSPVKDLPNGGSDEWYAAGFGLDVSTAITTTLDYSVGVNDIDNDNVSAPYPNPVADLLTIPVRKNIKGNVTVEIFDVAGKLVLTENKVLGTEKLQINVASIANGSYVFTTTFADGSKDTFKVSVSR
ncbi:MAG: T9SS type A sorting domain-containing protein [Flavobacteriales bacterium]|nr:T9SS type A sorting domain-containing protein [Flavobacteriales bacterium]MCB9363085.1 T9SS type A sorting domain-containing protein [Flavobacteriales bacterium]